MFTSFTRFKSFIGLTSFTGLTGFILLTNFNRFTCFTRLTSSTRITVPLGSSVWLGLLVSLGSLGSLGLLVLLCLLGFLVPGTCWSFSHILRYMCLSLCWPVYLSLQLQSIWLRWTKYGLTDLGHIAELQLCDMTKKTKSVLTGYFGRESFGNVFWPRSFDSSFLAESADIIVLLQSIASSDISPCIWKGRGPRIWRSGDFQRNRALELDQLDLFKSSFEIKCTVLFCSKIVDSQYHLVTSTEFWLVFQRLPKNLHTVWVLPWGSWPGVFSLSDLFKSGSNKRFCWQISIDPSEYGLAVQWVR